MDDAYARFQQDLAGVQAPPPGPPPPAAAPPPLQPQFVATPAPPMAMPPPPIFHAYHGMPPPGFPPMAPQPQHPHPPQQQQQQYGTGTIAAIRSAQGMATSMGTIMGPGAAAVQAAAQAAAKAEGKAGPQKKGGHLREAAGTRWRDPTLDEWPKNDFRIFVGDLGNEVNDDALAKAFQKYASFAKAKIVKDKRTKKSKGFGFISFLDSTDYAKALKEMNGKYIGNRPVKLRKSTWDERNPSPPPHKKRKQQEQGQGGGGGGGGGAGGSNKQQKK